MGAVYISGLCGHILGPKQCPFLTKEQAGEGIFQPTFPFLPDSSPGRGYNLSTLSLAVAYPALSLFVG